MGSLLEIIVLNWSLASSLIRACAFAAVLPSFGIVGRGMRPRILLGVVLALVLASARASSIEPPRDMMEAILIELTNGLAIGFTLRVVLSAVHIIAHMVEQQIGLPTIGDGDEECTSPINRLYQIVSLAVFVCLSGHRTVLVALLRVSDVENVASDAAALADTAVRLIAVSWYLAIQSILPLVVSLLTAQLAAGMVARIVPHLAGSAVTVPIHIVVGFILIFLSLASMSVSFSHGVDWALQVVHGP